MAYPISFATVGFVFPGEKPAVTLGMCYGHLLSNAQGLLLSGSRKQVYVLPIRSLD